jgi:hypothetical protein
LESPIEKVLKKVLSRKKELLEKQKNPTPMNTSE